MRFRARIARTLTLKIKKKIKKLKKIIVQKDLYIIFVNKGAFVCLLNNCFYLISYYDYFDKLRLENIKLLSRQDSLHSCHHNLDIVSTTV